MRVEKQRELFLSRINKETITNCWEWMGKLDKYGYGVLKRNGKYLLAHRYSWEIHVGKPPKDLCVLHKCDNKKCLNPEHLYLGTHKDNAQDRLIRNPTTVGSGCSWSKLTEEDVMKIRSLHAAKCTYREIARLFPQVCVEHIKKVALRKRWKHVI